MPEIRAKLESVQIQQAGAERLGRCDPSVFERNGLFEKIPQNKHFVLVLFLLPGWPESSRGGCVPASF
jgi:hypothetical protein